VGLQSGDQIEYMSAAGGEGDGNLWLMTPSESKSDHAGRNSRRWLAAARWSPDDKKDLLEKSFDNESYLWRWITATEMKDRC